MEYCLSRLSCTKNSLAFIILPINAKLTAVRFMLLFLIGFFST